jgi:PTH1 family peptidyl-tRNA hydrolase
MEKWLILGLGNPGKEFEKTFHNVGRETVEKIQKEWGFSDWQKKEKEFAEICQGKVFNQKVILAKTLVYMNESGKAAKALLDFFKIKPEHLIVIQDEADLAIGKVKISQNRGPAGHKGIVSLIEYLKTKNFVRLRIGIRKNKKDKAQVFVLKKIKTEDKKTIEKAQEKTISLLKDFLKNQTKNSKN